MFIGKGMEFVPQQFKRIWERLWGIIMSRKIVCFTWWLIHRAIPIDEWRKCVHCEPFLHAFIGVC